MLFLLVTLLASYGDASCHGHAYRLQSAIKQELHSRTFLAITRYGHLVYWSVSWALVLPLVQLDPRGHVEICRYLFGCQNWRLVLLASVGRGKGNSSVPCSAQDGTMTENSLPQHVPRIRLRSPGLAVASREVGAMFPGSVVATHSRRA